ncbi:MAG TPA: glutamate synthase central domain-containing protein, partial [Chloroflexota bacterium]
MGEDHHHTPTRLPGRQGLYDPNFEHDACGIGFVVDIKGKKSNDIVRQALTVLKNLIHRGAVGAEHNTGDGAGILFQLPHTFLRKAAAEAGVDLPEPGQYGVGMVFLPTDAAERARCERVVEETVVAEGQRFLGWRTVPVDNSMLGASSLAGEPVIRQAFIGRQNVEGADLAFERKLYVIRRVAEKAIRYPEGGAGNLDFYFASLSYKTIVYKGMLLTEQLDAYYPDLLDPSMESALALVHSRFSTNTFPSWSRSQPFRYLMHNGEINTLRGNVNWMHAREALLSSELFGDDLPKVMPIIDPDGSDSAMFDNTLEFLVLAGRSLPHAMMMMIPEPWQNHESMSDEKRAFYEFHSCLMEPWDGPASMGFTDGIRVGAVLDRNGLRPSRYYVTTDGMVVMASEVGVLDIPAERVLYKRRLEPGRMLLVDTEAGRIVEDAELKSQIATEKPYREWLDSQMVKLESLPSAESGGGSSALGERLILGGLRTGSNGRGNYDLNNPDTVIQRQQAFGYTFEELRIIMGPMAKNAVEPVGSMGNDAPLAVLSDKPQLLYNYFKQLFAQVTNPPIDALREELITSSEVLLGSEGNLLDPAPEHCRLIKLKAPILTNRELSRLRHLDRPGFKSRTLSILFPIAEGGAGLERGMERLFDAARRAVDDGVNILILSDRG